MQLPQEVSSSMLSADGPLLAEDSSPLPTAQAAAPSSSQAAMQHMAVAPAAQAAGVEPSPRQQAQLLCSPVKGAAAAPAASAVAAGASGSSPGVASTGSNKRTPSPAAGTDIEDEYEESDLDDDWKALLGGVDARLKAVNMRPMNARERAIAIKKLLVATGTRGVEFALNTTLQVSWSLRQPAC
jgi:hypothetical protein